MLERVVVGVLGLLWLSTGCSGENANDRTTGMGTAQAECECPLDWQIDNLAVCVSQHTAFTDTLLYSSALEEGEIACDPARGFPQPVPNQAWSAQRISSPCVGSGSLTVRVRQGSAKDPEADDCIIAEQTLQFDYSSADTPLALPVLNAWSAQDRACARSYEDEGGYLEFRVESAQVGCGKNGSAVKYVNQCPVRCDVDPSGPGCEDCGSGTITTSF